MNAGAGAAGAGAVGSKVYAGAVRAAPPRAQFYGHNPNLKLPPDLFLLGCVFHIVSLSSTSFINNHGGVVISSLPDQPGAKVYKVSIFL